MNDQVLDRIWPMSEVIPIMNCKMPTEHPCACSDALIYFFYIVFENKVYRRVYWWAHLYVFFCSLFLGTWEQKLQQLACTSFLEDLTLTHTSELRIWGLGSWRTMQWGESVLLGAAKCTVQLHYHLDDLTSMGRWKMLFVLLLPLAFCIDREGTI